MAVPWGLVVFLIGIAYGYMAPGKTDKSRIFWKGLIWGFISAVVLALIGWVFNVNPLGIEQRGVIGFTVAVVVLTIFFILGVFIGDFIEGRRARHPRRV